MALEVYLGDEFKCRREGNFYAIRIGTHKLNDVVIRSDAEGVHEHHCTVVHTGSTYRLEMIPNHIVDVDGRPAECGQQLFVQHNREECTLSIGGAPQKGSAAPYPPPVVRLKRVGESTKPPPRPNERKERKNLEPGWQLRLQMGWVIGVGLLLAALIGGGSAAYAWWDTGESAKMSARLGELQKAYTGGPAGNHVKVAQNAVMQMGLMKGDGSDDFDGLGTAWVWQDDDSRDAQGNPVLRLVTNRHVVEQVNTCVRAETTEPGCKTFGGGCPAVRYSVTDANGDVVNTVPQRLMTGCTSGTPLKDRLLKHQLHPYFQEFASRLTGEDAKNVPNVYDIAIFEMPRLEQWKGEGLRIAKVPEAERGQPVVPVVQVGMAIGAFGIPIENEKRASALPTMTTGNVGRVTDPFGLPAANGDYIVITGAVVQGGDSGGPIINGQGEVIAMKFAGFFINIPAGERPARIDFGSKYKALNARLVREAVSLPADGAPPGAQQTGWDAGLASMSDDYLDRVLTKTVTESCPDAKDYRIDPAKPVYQSKIGPSRPLAAADKDASPAFKWTWGHGGEIKVPFDEAGDRLQSFLFVAENAADQTQPVFARVQRHVVGGKAQALDSSTAFSALATIKDDSLYDGQPTSTYSYDIYSTTKSEFDLKVYRIACPPAQANQASRS